MRTPESGIVPQDPPLELSQVRPRLQPELLRELVPSGLEYRKRVRLPAGAVEREHQLTPQPLPQRISIDEPLELGHELSGRAERELRVRQLLERRQSPLLEPPALAARKRLVEHICEGRPSPDGQRQPQQPRRRARIPGRPCFSPGVHEALEAVKVELVGFNAEGIAARPPEEPIAPNHPAQPRDVRVERLLDARGWLLAPECVDQVVT